MAELVHMDPTAAVHAPAHSRSTRARAARRLAAGLGAVFAFAALPAVASAADYCVYPNQNCDGPHNVQHFEDALAAAENGPDPDRIFLGAATYTAPNSGGFDYYQSGPVEIAGQGTGQTVLTSPPVGEYVVGLFGGPGTSIHDLTISMPQTSAAGTAGLLTNNAARNIHVTDDGAQAYVRSGVELQWGATLEDSSVALDGGTETYAVRLGPSGSTVRRSALSAQTAVRTQYGGTIESSRLTGVYDAVSALGGQTTITGSLLRVTGSSSSGIFAAPSPGVDTSVNADGVTIVGSGLANTTGVGVGNEPADGQSAVLNLTNAIIRDFPQAVYAQAGGAGHTRVAISYSDYDPSGNVTDGVNATISETNVSNVGDARFVDAAAGDYHLTPSSPLIDAGDPATPQGLDLDGNPLVADGNGDGSARRDLGAFELQPAPVVGGQPGGTAAAADHQPPLVSGFRATPSVFAIGRARTAVAAKLPRGTRFRYTLSEAARVRVTIQRRLAGRRARYRRIGTLRRTGAKGSNRIRFSGRIGRRALRPGRYRAVLSATDAAGNRSTLRRTRFRVGAG